MAWVSAITAYIGILTHCNVAMDCGLLSQVFNTPTLHRWHHARDSAIEAGVAACFTAFLPKPEVLIDDVAPDAWNMRGVHPGEASGVDVAALTSR